MNGRGFHPEALIIGVTFVLVGVLFALDRLGAWDLDVTYVWPLVLIGLGPALRRRTHPRHRRSAGLARRGGESADPTAIARRDSAAHRSPSASRCAHRRLTRFAIAMIVRMGGLPSDSGKRVASAT